MSLLTGTIYLCMDRSSPDWNCAKTSTSKITVASSTLSRPPQPKECQGPKGPVQRTKVEARPHESTSHKSTPLYFDFEQHLNTEMQHLFHSVFARTCWLQAWGVRLHTHTPTGMGADDGCLILRRGLRDEGQGIWADDRNCTSWASKILP